jgi:hypothetical protein
MPIHLTLDTALHCVRAHLSGTITVDEVIAFAERLGDMLLLQLAVLYDARAASFPWTIEDLRRIKAKLIPLREEHGAAPVAFVASDDFSFDLGRMYAGLAHDYNPQFAVFRSMEEGEAWIRSLRPHPGDRSMNPS